jgi:hypothetical protein
MVMSSSSGTTNNPGGGSLYIDIKSLWKKKTKYKWHEGEDLKIDS